MGNRIVLVNTTANHRKFWSVQVVGRIAVCEWGRINTWVQSKTFKFASTEEARGFALHKAESKLARGYRIAA